MRGMLKRSYNEVINIFMNKINHTLTLQPAPLKGSPFLTPTSWGRLGPVQTPSHRQLQIFMRGQSGIDT